MGWSVQWPFWPEPLAGSCTVYASVPTGQDTAVTHGPCFGGLWKAFSIICSQFSSALRALSCPLIVVSLRVERHICRNIPIAGISLRLSLSLYHQWKNKLNIWARQSFISFLFYRWTSTPRCMFCISLWGPVAQCRLVWQVPLGWHLISGGPLSFSVCGALWIVFSIFAFIAK